MSAASAGRFFTTEPPGEPPQIFFLINRGLLYNRKKWKPTAMDVGWGPAWDPPRENVSHSSCHPFHLPAKVPGGALCWHPQAPVNICEHGSFEGRAWAGWPSAAAE